MIHLLLPGTNNFYYGEEIGMTNLPDNFANEVFILFVYILNKHFLFCSF